VGWFAILVLAVGTFLIWSPAFTHMPKPGEESSFDQSVAFIVIVVACLFETVLFWLIFFVILHFFR
jgi:predicted cobalt transporter CbtA